MDQIKLIVILLSKYLFSGNYLKWHNRAMRIKIRNMLVTVMCNYSMRIDKLNGSLPVFYGLYGSKKTENGSLIKCCFVQYLMVGRIKITPRVLFLVREL